MDDRHLTNVGEPEPQLRTRTASGRPRKHMGVASSDPTYLPPVGGQTAKGARSAWDAEPSRTQASGSSAGSPHAAAHGRAPRTNNNPLHYDRYISVPKKGRSIFTARQTRQRHRLLAALIILILAAIALALTWYFFLR